LLSIRWNCEQAACDNKYEDFFHKMGIRGGFAESLLRLLTWELYDSCFVLVKAQSDQISVFFSFVSECLHKALPERPLRSPGRKASGLLKVSRTDRVEGLVCDCCPGVNESGNFFSNLRKTSPVSFGPDDCSFQTIHSKNARSIPREISGKTPIRHARNRRIS
jgi:hypothetical protein